MKKITGITMIFGLLLLVTFIHSAYAHPANYRHQHKHSGPGKHGPAIKYQNRHRVFPDRKYKRVLFNSAHYLFHAGIFYRQIGDELIIVNAPDGLIIDSLPHSNSIVVINDRRYYVVNGTYFIKVKSGYKVTKKPATIIIMDSDEIDESSSENIVLEEDDIITTSSSNNTKNKSKDDDSYECHRWGVSQSGYDPTLKQTKEDDGAEKIYKKSKKACMTIRGN